MRKSENFDLNLYEGTDIFNPLTTDVPNYEKIDAQMEKNYNLTVGKATELKTGTVHALTRENADCPMIHFTATSNFTSNDTFTVDGVQVSALLVDGSTLPTNCYIIGSEVICYLKGTLLTFFLSGSISKDSEKLGGELPAYYSKQEDFEQLETSVNSMSGVVEKNSNDIVDLNRSLNDKQNNLTRGIYTDYLSNISTDKLQPNSVVWITPETKDSPFTGQYGVAITFEAVVNIYIQICFPYNAAVNVPYYRIYANNSWGIWINF